MSNLGFGHYDRNELLNPLANPGTHTRKYFLTDILVSKSVKNADLDSSLYIISGLDGLKSNNYQKYFLNKFPIVYLNK